MIQSAKKEVFGRFLTMVRWNNLILHVVIELYPFEHSALLPDHLGSFKSHKNAFLNDPGLPRLLKSPKTPKIFKFLLKSPKTPKKVEDYGIFS